MRDATRLMALFVGCIGADILLKEKSSTVLVGVNFLIATVIMLVEEICYAIRERKP